MKRFATSCRTVLLALCFMPMLRTVNAMVAADTTLTKETLAPNIYLFRAPSALDYWTATNVVVVVNDADITVFDSNTRPGTARMVIAEIRKISNKPVRTLVNSHWHMDHWSGNAEYAKAFPGVQIISTTETRNYMKRMSPAFFADEIGGRLPYVRASLDSAIRTGKNSDGTPFTAESRKAREANIDVTDRFMREMAAIPRVLPNVVFRDTLIFWSGQREFRLISVTGDATGSTVMYLPAEKLLVVGDVLVGPESGEGPPQWTTNSYSISPWLTSLKGLQTLDATSIVPGQGAAFRDKNFLNHTVDLFSSVIAQVHTALEQGAVSIDDVQKKVNVDAIGRKYSPASTGPDREFKALVAQLVKKVYQESLDGIGR